MPYSLSSLPPAPTPEQIAKLVVDAAVDVIQTVTTAATTAQNSVEKTADQSVENVNRSVVAVNTATQAAFIDLRTSADRAKNKMQSTADRAVADFQRLVGEVLKLVGHVPTPAELAIGDVNGEPFFEPLGCFVLFMKAVQENKNQIKVRLREPAVAQAFRDFVGSTQDEIARQLRPKVMTRITTGQQNLVEPVSTSVGAAAILDALPPVVWIILAIAVLILSVAVSIFVVLMAVAIVYALIEHYNIENVHLDLSTPLAGITFGADFKK